MRIIHISAILILSLTAICCSQGIVTGQSTSELLAGDQGKTWKLTGIKVLANESSETRPGLDLMHENEEIYYTFHQEGKLRIFGLCSEQTEYMAVGDSTFGLTTNWSIDDNDNLLLPVRDNPPNDWNAYRFKVESLSNNKLVLKTEGLELEFEEDK